jgi:transketolase
MGEPRFGWAPGAWAASTDSGRTVSALAETAGAPPRDIARFADRIRLRAVRMISPHGLGYLGQALSSAELFAALYTGRYQPGRDELVVSPGHYMIAAFAAAAEAGLLDESALDTYGFESSALEAIGTERSPAVDLVSGSLGQGLSGAVGLALSRRLRGVTRGRVFAVVSDGELEEGQLWEAALFAGHHRLANLVVLLDANNSQVDGPVSSITTLEPLAAKWESFGWTAFDVNGHDAEALSAALDAAPAGDRPAVVIGRTSTTQGLSVLPPDADGHFIKLPPELAAAAVAELEARLA